MRTDRLGLVLAGMRLSSLLFLTVSLRKIAVAAEVKQAMEAAKMAGVAKPNWER